MTALKETNYTTTKINDYGVNVTTNTITKVFTSMDEVRHDVEVAKPLYLKHAHPRTGKIKIDETDTSITLSWVREEGLTNRHEFYRVYRTERYDEHGRERSFS